MQFGLFSERGDDAALRRSVQNPCETDFFLRKNSPTQDLPLPPDLFLAEYLSLSLSLSLSLDRGLRPRSQGQCSCTRPAPILGCQWTKLSGKYPGARDPYSNRRVPVDEALGQVSRGARSLRRREAGFSAIVAFGHDRQANFAPPHTGRDRHLRRLRFYVFNSHLSFCFCGWRSCWVLPILHAKREFSCRKT